MESREQRIATLASTLKTSGIAKSESQARMMAEEMIGVEEHVQRNFEEKHAEAHEHMMTSKNLGVSRQTKVQVEPVPSPLPEQKSSKLVAPDSRKIAPMDIQGAISKHFQNESVQKKQQAQPEYNDMTFGKKTLNQAFSEHDTHNAALESIKSQIQREETFAEPVKKADVPARTEIIREVDDIVGDIEDIESSELSEPSEVTAADAPIESKLPFLEIDKEEAEVKKEDDVIEKEESEIEKGEEVVEEEAEDVKLDTEKLVEMMEEDGNKMEEHTRQITEKPANVKPKEDYVENSIDLSSVFGFKKK